MSKLTHHACPLCSSDNIHSEITLKDYSISKEEFEIYRCADCTFLFTQNIPSEEHIGKYYESEDYISHSDTTTGLVNKLYHGIRKIMLKKKYQQIKRLKTGKKLLDIGCGTGYFLNYMKMQGYDTLGVEADEDARAYGEKKFDLKILEPEHLINGKIDRQFNIVSLWHVLEHIHDLNNYLKIISSLLEDDGFLIIAVPNPHCFDATYYKSFWAGYDVPRHIWHFTPETMEKFATDNHFEIVSLKRLPYDPFYNSILSERYQNNLLALFFGTFIGFISYIKGAFNVRKASSVIYILKKLN